LPRGAPELDALHFDTRILKVGDVGASRKKLSGHFWVPLKEPVMISCYQDFVAVRLRGKPVEKAFYLKAQALSSGIARMNENISFWELDPLVGIVRVGDANQAHGFLSEAVGDIGLQQLR
jgi:hypothetical protein